MKKYNFLLMLVLLSVNSFVLPAINKGYTELDTLFESESVENKSNKWSKIFNILSSYHIDPNTYYLKTPEGKFSQKKLLDLAISQGNMNAVKKLINKYKMNITDKAFMAAIENDRQEALKFLLNKGGVPTADVISYAHDVGKKWATNMFAHHGFTL